MEQKGGEDRLKVVDRRRFAHYTPKKFPAEEDEALRRACFGASDQLAENKALQPVGCAEGRRQSEPYTWRSLISAGIATIATIGVLGFYILTSKPPENQRSTREPVRTATTQTEIYRAEQMPDAPEIVINVEAFNRYQSRYEEKQNEFRNSHQLHMREVPIPHGIWYGGRNPMKAFAFDINGDGMEEIYVLNGCTSNVGADGKDCRGYVYQNSGSGYVEILDGPIDRISVSERIVNGYPVVHHTWKSAGGFDVEYEYTWNGQKYVESDKFVMPENIQAIAENIQIVFKSENPEERSRFLRRLGDTIGTYDAMRALLQFQASPDFTVPTGSEYVEYVRAYASETARTNPELAEKIFNRYADDPTGFFAALYGRSLYPVFLNISGPKSLAAVSLMMKARGFGKSDWERHMKFWDSAQGGIGPLAAYKSKNDDYPRTEHEIWSAMNNVIGEEQLRTHGAPTTPSYDTEPGTTQRSTLGEITGDPNYQRWQPQVDERQQREERANQIDQETQDIMRREGGRAIDEMGRGAGQAIDGARNFFESRTKPPEKR